jgi:predicted nucleic acid-binding protein
VRRYVLDTNCYIDASRDSGALTALSWFSSKSAPGLYLSTVVAAELRAGVGSMKARKALERDILGPFVRRRRVITPSAAAWDALGLTLATLRETEGVQLARVPRSFAFDILLAYSCRESGAILVTGNARDMRRIRHVFAFEFEAPYPDPSD